MFHKVWALRRTGKHVGGLVIVEEGGGGGRGRGRDRREGVKGVQEVGKYKLVASCS